MPQAKQPSSCECPCNDNSLPEKGRLSSSFGKFASIAGSGIGSFLLGHAGCIITPIILATAGITAATGGISVIAFAFGAAASAGGLYLWHKLRGRTASPREKRLVIGSTVSGLALSAALHFGGIGDAHKHHGPSMDRKINPTEMPADVQQWFDGLDSTRRAKIERNARMTGFTLAEYLSGVCIVPSAPAPAQDAPRKAPAP